MVIIDQCMNYMKGNHIKKRYNLKHLNEDRNLGENNYHFYAYSKCNYLRNKILDNIWRWTTIKTEARHGAFCLRRNLRMKINSHRNTKREILVLQGKIPSGSNSVPQV